MNQNRLSLLVGILLVLVIGMGIYIWREQQRTDGVEIKIDDKGISVQGQ